MEGYGYQKGEVYGGIRERGGFWVGKERGSRLEKGRVKGGENVEGYGYQKGEVYGG